MTDLKLVISSRCFFPFGAWGYSTKRMAELAKGVGYEGVEFLPTCGFVWEMTRYGKLLAHKDMVASGHRDWRFDRVMEAKLLGKPGWWYQLRNKEDWLFPPSGWCYKAIKKFQKKYKVPVVTHWFGEAEKFSPVLLELWSVECGVDQKQLIEWLSEDPKRRGVVIDTAKFTSWCRSNNLKREDVFKEIEPFVKEVQYRVKGKYLKRIRSFSGGLSDDSDENLSYLLKSERWRGTVVVEFGWPDILDAAFSWVGGDLKRFEEAHRVIIDYIKSF